MRIQKAVPGRGGDVSPLESCRVDSQRAKFIFPQTRSLPFTAATFVGRFSGCSLGERDKKKWGGGRGAGGTAGSRGGLSKSGLSVLHEIKCRTNALVYFP